MYDWFVGYKSVKQILQISKDCTKYGPKNANEAMNGLRMRDTFVPNIF